MRSRGCVRMEACLGFLMTRNLTLGMCRRMYRTGRSVQDNTFKLELAFISSNQFCFKFLLSVPSLLLLN